VSAVPRMKERTPALRAQVLDGAMGLLATDGVDALTARRVAGAASTSVAAVYELFGDKGGLVREIFYEGFRELAARFAELDESDDPRRDLHAAMAAFRTFANERPALVAVMFSRPFAEFAPTPADAAAGRQVRRILLGLVRRAVEAGEARGDPTDLAHVLLALAQGLAAQEAAGWLGTSKASRDRRWRLAVDTVLAG